MLHIIFGDDEHTAADGSYARVMKTRKWLYLSAAASFAVTTGLYNESAAAEILKVVKLPLSVIAPALVLTVTYLLLQYVALIIQLAVTYDIVLTERFIFRRADELTKARDSVIEAQQKLGERLASLRGSKESRHRDKIFSLSEDLEEAEQALVIISGEKNAAIQDKTRSTEVAELFLKEKRIRDEQADLLAKLQKMRADKPSEINEYLDPGVISAQSTLETAEAALADLQRQVPSERRGYRGFEHFIDIIRVIPPSIVAMVAIVKYLSKFVTSAGG